MKFRLFLFSLVNALSLFLALNAQNLNLPVVNKNGNEFYCYEVNEEETPYAIAKKFGWDLNQMMRINPEANEGIKKGMKLYYPLTSVEKVTPLVEVTINPESIRKEDDTVKSVAVSKSSGEDRTFDRTYPPIVHKVKKGETIYGISRQYDIPLERIYTSYPEVKQGVKPGMMLTFEQTSESVSKGYFYYTVQRGDALSYLAREYDTNIDDILALNPGVTEKNFKEGQVIRIKVGTGSEPLYASEGNKKSKKGHQITKKPKETTVKETEVEIIDLTNEEVVSSSPVTQNSQPINNEIAEKPDERINDVVINELSFNAPEENENSVKEDEVVIEEDITEIAIEPSTEELSVEENGEENTDLPSEIDEINIAILLDEPSSNKDIDFTRGFLVALKEMGKPEYKINLELIDGRTSSSNIISALEDYEPDFVISTADRAFPAFLADYGNTNDVTIINAFDVRNDLYEDNTSMVQMLPGSEMFNQIIAENLVKDYKDYNLIIVGGAEENEGLGTYLSDGMGKDNSTFLSLSEFGEFVPDPDKKYMIYATESKKDDVKGFFKNLLKIQGENQDFEYKIIGRPNWIMFIDDMGKQFAETGVIIPSRVWLDEKSLKWEEFKTTYSAMFDSDPVKSFPNFAASGYDMANYFINSFAKNGGRLQSGNNYSGNMLQSVIDLKRINNWSGFMNSTAYLLMNLPSGNVRSVKVN